MIRFFATCTLAVLVGCDKAPTGDAVMVTTQPPNTLKIARDGVDVFFPVTEAAFNWIVRPHGCEFTLICKTGELEGQDHNPKMEATIVLPAEPEIAVGSEWLDQPAYIEKDPLYNLTNYYEWTHEGFEDFSLRILEVSGSRLKCHLTGFVSLNPSGRNPVPVSILADFDRDQAVKRGVW